MGTGDVTGISWPVILLGIPFHIFKAYTAGREGLGGEVGTGLKKFVDEGAQG